LQRTLNHIVWRAGQRLGDTGEVWNDRLDAVTLSFDLALDLLHLVTVERVGHIAADVDGGSHFASLDGVASLSVRGVVYSQKVGEAVARSCIGDRQIGAGEDEDICLFLVCR
jgi:hypothetical protein